jgi:Fe-S-cluster containining protein
MNETESSTFNLEFNAGSHSIEASVAIPKAPMRVADLLPVLLGFSNAIVGLAAEEAKDAGHPVSCHAGCGACCRQVVPIAESEAEYLAAYVAALPDQRREQVRERFRAAVEALGEEVAGPLRDTTRFQSLEDRRAIGLEYFRKHVACPFLEKESCSIYEHRPLSCREYLVSSPPKNCEDPGPDRIAPVPVPLKLSEMLYGFDESGTKRGVRWLPLVLALEWAEQHANDTPRYAAGTALFEGFMKHLAAVSNER